MLIAPNRQSWKGNVRIRPGMGIFQGYAGDNAEHRHWAHQLSIGQGSDLMVVFFADDPAAAHAAILNLKLFPAEDIHNLAAV